MNGVRDCIRIGRSSPEESRIDPGKSLPRLYTLACARAWRVQSRTVALMLRRDILTPFASPSPLPVLAPTPVHRLFGLASIHIPFSCLLPVGLFNRSHSPPDFSEAHGVHFFSLVENF